MEPGNSISSRIFRVFCFINGLAHMARGTVTVYSLPNINIGSSKVYFTIRVSNIFCLHVGGERFVAEIAAVLRLGAPPRCNRLFFCDFCMCYTNLTLRTCRLLDLWLSIK